MVHHSNPKKLPLDTGKIPEVSLNEGKNGEKLNGDKYLADSRIRLLTTSASDVLIGIGSGDVFTGTTATDVATDIIVDAATGDADVFNYAVTTDPVALTVANVETVNLTTTIVGGTALTVDASTYRGVDALNITRGNVGNISGTGSATVTVIGGQVDAVNTVSGVNALTVVQTTADGTTVTATGVTGAVTLRGAGTVVAASSTGTVIVSAEDGAGAALAAALLDGAISVTANSAATVTVDDGAGAFSGNVTVEAASATAVNVETTGASVINTGSTATASSTITVNNVDASGTTVTSGLTGTTTVVSTINLDGTTATTDVATVSAIGAVALNVGATDEIETVNLSGNGATVTYTITSTAGDFDTITATGSSTVNVTTTGTLINDAIVSGVATLTISAAAGGATLDLADVSANVIVLPDNGGDDVTVRTGSVVNLVDQTTQTDIFAGTDNATVTLVTTDDVAGSGVGTVTLLAVDMNDTNDFATVNISAVDGHLNATAFDVADGAVIVTGTRNVALGTLTATSVDASALTGTFGATMTANSTTVLGAQGVNTITLNGAATMSLTTYVGADAITVTTVADGTVISTGEGADDITLTDAGANVFDLGSGNDVVDVAQDADIDSVIMFGDGTGDSIEFDSTANLNLSDNTNFAMYDVEDIDVTATTAGVTISATQFALDNTFTLTGDNAADTLIVAAAATGSTIDASGVTIATGATATLTINGGAAVDTITGGASGETIDGGTGADVINSGAGNDTVDGGGGADSVTLGLGDDEYDLDQAADLAAGETVDGGDGTDTLDYSVAAVVDLTIATFTNFEVLSTGGQQVTLGHGTGITTVNDYADNTAGTFILSKLTTNFESAEEANAAAVNIAGEWFLLDETAVPADAALTYYDESIGEAVTITLVGTGGGADDTIAVVAGNLVYTVV